MAVIVQLIGGLGNQMFQYAAGRTLSHRLEVPLKLDIKSFKDYKLRSYRLNHFDIQENIATRGDLEPFSIPEKGLPLLLFRAKNFILPRHKKRIFIENKDGFDEDFGRISGSCLLKGYWQSEKYFKNIEDIIRNEFRVIDPIDHKNKLYLDKIRNSTSVCVHVRRGDYVSNPDTNKIHGFLGKKYYKKAIDYFEAKLEDPIFFVFSDDIEWTQANISANYPLVFVEHNGEERDYEDLRLMMNCKYHIIANSSFSWWGAWLSDYKEQQVIAPKNWFTPHAMEKKGDIEIVPDRWICI